MSCSRIYTYKTVLIDVHKDLIMVIWTDQENGISQDHIGLVSCQSASRGEQHHLYSTTDPKPDSTTAGTGKA